jgi:hypothetical protein
MKEEESKKTDKEREIRLLIADSQTLSRKGLIALLHGQKGMRIVGRRFSL